MLPVKKLLINGLLVLVFVALFIALVLALSRLRAVDETEASVDEVTAGQEAALTEEIAIVEQTAVKVNVGNSTNTSKTITSKTNTSKTTAHADEDVDAFLNGLS